MAAGQITPYPPGIPAIVPSERINAAFMDNLQSGHRAGMVLPDPADPSLQTIRVTRHEAQPSGWLRGKRHHCLRMHGHGRPPAGERLQARFRTDRITHMMAPTTSRIMPIQRRNMAALTATPKMRRTIPTMISVITIPMSRWYSNSTQIVVVPVGFLAGK